MDEAFSNITAFKHKHTNIYLIKYLFCISFFGLKQGERYCPPKGKLIEKVYYSQVIKTKPAQCSLVLICFERLLKIFAGKRSLKWYVQVESPTLACEHTAILWFRSTLIHRFSISFLLVMLHFLHICCIISLSF